MSAVLRKYPRAMLAFVVLCLGAGVAFAVYVIVNRDAPEPAQQVPLGPQVESSVGIMGSFLISVPAGWYASEGRVLLLTNTEGLLPPEEKPDDYEAPIPQTGQVVVNFYGLTPSNFDFYEIELTRETTAMEVATAVRAYAEESALEVGDLRTEKAGNFEIALYDRTDEASQYTEIFLKATDLVFFRITAQHPAGEFAKFQDDVFSIIQTLGFEPAIAGGTSPKPGRWQGSGSDYSVSFTVTEENAITNFRFSIGFDECTLRVTDYPITYGSMLLINEQGGVFGSSQFSDLAIGGEFSETNITGVYSYALLCNMMNVSGENSYDWTATWQEE